MAWRGVALVGSVKSERLVEVIAQGGPLAEMLASTRAAIRRAVVSSVQPWSARSAAVVNAILIGDRAGLDPQVERRLQEAGYYHVRHLRRQHRDTRGSRFSSFGSLDAPAHFSTVVCRDARCVRVRVEGGSSALARH